ncbi:Nuclear transport factor 2B [Hibiscus syriacus]|uniref:Nuclear transport factor 2B n=1 Tax=Hibiscus syriacus TaxID=106335 RepID=A0A6A3BSM2_HIBSY|nr:uncharacterized protein LOC120210839 [Hibiscus syriacus]KAE8719663.1 Nuclear transport factor 2B [Hibiscus syriacus]
MESGEDIELINMAIQKLLEETRMTDISGEKPLGNDDNQLLSRLFSQLESLKEDGKLKQSEPGEVNSQKGDGDKAEAKSENGTACGGIGVEELRKEIKELKKQNFITHCLVSAMIVIALFWQVSEASLLLKVKDGFSHPFSSFGSWLVNKVKRPANQQHNHLIEHSGHSVQIPELPHVEFPHLGSSGEGY